MSQQDELLLPPDDLMALADVGPDDIQAAIEWWNEQASEAWKGALDEPAGTESA